MPDLTQLLPRTAWAALSDTKPRAHSQLWLNEVTPNLLIWLQISSSHLRKFQLRSTRRGTELQASSFQELSGLKAMLNFWVNHYITMVYSDIVTETRNHSKYNNNTVVHPPKWCLRNNDSRMRGTYEKCGIGWTHSGYNRLLRWEKASLCGKCLVW